MRVWQDEAKCRDMDPRLFDEENLADTASALGVSEADVPLILCRGCGVVEECHSAATQPIDMRQVVGAWAREADAAEDSVYQSGVIRGGICLGTASWILEHVKEAELRDDFAAVRAYRKLLNGWNRHDPDGGWGDVRGSSGYRKGDSE